MARLRQLPACFDRGRLCYSGRQGAARSVGWARESGADVGRPPHAHEADAVPRQRAGRIGVSFSGQHCRDARCRQVQRLLRHGLQSSGRGHVSCPLQVRQGRSMTSLPFLRRRRVVVPVRGVLLPRIPDNSRSLGLLCPRYWILPLRHLPDASDLVEPLAVVFDSRHPTPAEMDRVESLAGRSVDHQAVRHEFLERLFGDFPLHDGHVPHALLQHVPFDRLYFLVGYLSFPERASARRLRGEVPSSSENLHEICPRAR